MTTPPDWVPTTLGEILEIHDRHRIPLSGKDRQDRQGPYPYYGASGVIDHIDDYIFDGRYLLVAEDGENLNSRKLPIAFFATGKFWVNNHAHVVRAIPGKANDDFIRAWFAQANISGYVTGAAQPKLSQGNLKRISLDLPSLALQDRIASILSTYDDLIENNLRRIQILEEVAQALYREWFVEFRYPGHDEVEGVFRSSLGSIPEGWVVVKLLDVADVQYGHPFKSKFFSEQPVGLPVVRIRDVPKRESATYTTEEADQKFLIRDGDVLVGMDGDFHRGIWSGGEAYQNQRVARFRPSLDGLGTCLLHHLITEPIEHLNQTIVGTTVAHLGHKHIKLIDVALPPSALLKRATDLFQPFADQRVSLEHRNRVLRNARDLLLPRLISGELDVSELDIDVGEAA